MNGTAVCCAASGGAAGVPPAEPMIAVAAHGDTTCGVLAVNGMVACWLAGAAWGAAPPIAPGQGSPNATYTALCVGRGFVCAVRRPLRASAQATAECWGGAGASMGAVPVAESLACGDAAVCGVNSTGRVVCAGGDGNGGALEPACDAAVSTGVPNACFGFAATAFDTGRAPGISPGDTIEVLLSRAGTCGAGAGTTGLAVFSADVGSAGAPPEWLDASRSVRVVVAGDTRGLSIDTTRIGALEVALGAGSCAGLLPGALQQRVRGSWGPHAPPRLLNATGIDSGGAAGLGPGDRLLLVFDGPTSAPRLDDRVLSAPLGRATQWTWSDDQRTAIARLAVADPAGRPGDTRVGALRVTLDAAADVRSRDWSSAPCNDSAGVGGGWGNAVAGVTLSGRGGGVIGTAGGETFAVALAAPIGAGAEAEPVAVRYGHARGFNFSAVGCAFAPDGASVRCRAAPGVGARLLVRVDARGLPNISGDAALSYASPVLLDVAPGEVGTDYGGPVALSGTEFGPAALSAVSDVVFTAVAGRAAEGGGGSGEALGEAFGGVGCRVTASDAVVTCTLGGVRGAALRAELRIGGQLTTRFSLRTGAPVVTFVAAAGGCTVGGGPPLLCTRGGDVVGIWGDNFGPAGGGGGLRVVCTPRLSAPGGVALVLERCAVTVAHRTINCTAPPGLGEALECVVSVLGVPSAPFASGVAFAPPLLTAPPAARVPAAGGVVALRGRQFGLAHASTGALRVLIDGRPTAPLAARAAADDAALDEVLVAVPRGAGREGHSLAVAVGGRVTAGIPMYFDAPATASCGLVALNGSTSSLLQARRAGARGRG